jgi:hypothetical protein
MVWQFALWDNPGRWGYYSGTYSFEQADKLAEKGNN